MAYPEKVTYNEKYNLRPIIEPDGQFSAEDANEVKAAVNKNALFHGVHQSLSALQAAHPTPPVGAFAYLTNLKTYKCVTVGWTAAGFTSEDVILALGFTPVSPAALNSKLDKGTYLGTAQDLYNFILDINAILQSDDTTLDQLQEIVSYIKQNKEDLQNLSISNIAGLLDALANKQEAFITDESLFLDTLTKTLRANVSIYEEDFTFVASQSFTLAFEPTNFLGIFVQGIRLQKSQYTYTAPDQLTINDPLDAGDIVNVQYERFVTQP